MFCSSCGQKLDDNTKFCPYCGAPTGAPVTPNNISAATPAGAVDSTMAANSAGAADSTRAANSARSAGVDKTLSADSSKATAKKPVNKALLASAIVLGVAVVAAASFGIHLLTSKKSSDTDNKQTTANTNDTQKEDSYLDAYQAQVTADNGHNVALIDFDGDNTPDLIYTSGSSYKLYTYKDNAVSEISITPGNTRANFSGNLFYNGEASPTQNRYEHFYFEYVPGAKLIRTHSADSTKNDFYISFDESLTPALSLQTTWSGSWTTYVDGAVAENDTFNKERISRGFDKLTRCEYYYDDVKTAYDNLSKKSSKTNILSDFVEGKIDAIDSITSVDTKNGTFSYSNTNYATYRSKYGASNTDTDYDYIDFDNDGVNELIVNGDSYERLFFDTCGDDVYLLFSSGGTADQANITTLDSSNVIVRSDTGHQGRQTYVVSTYDSCGCLVDWYGLSAEYYDNQNDRYDANSTFTYRDNKISMKDYMKLASALNGSEKSDAEIENNIMISTYESYINGLDLYADLEKFQFIYLDDDDIPELVAIGGGDNVMVFAYKDGKVSNVPDTLCPSHSSFKYKAKSGQFVYSCSASPEYYNTLYTYKDGKFTKKDTWSSSVGDSGHSYDYIGDENYYYDEYSDDVTVYYMNDEQISEDEYDAQNAKFDKFTSVTDGSSNVWTAADSAEIKY